MTLYNICMRLAGISVPNVVREIITRNRSIYDCMKMDVINFTALAVKIQPDVERELGGSVNLNTIVVAIKRYSDAFNEKEEISDEPVLHNARLSLTDGIIDIKIPKRDFEDQTTSILDKFSQITPDFDFFRLTDSVRFLTEDIADVRKIFESFSNTSGLFNTGLTRIKISVPIQQKRSDVVSYVAEVLHTNGIELVNAFFSQDNIIIILNDVDGSRAYEILRSNITK